MVDGDTTVGIEKDSSCCSADGGERRVRGFLNMFDIVGFDAHT